MNNTPAEIFKFYKSSADYKASIGTKGLYEQGKINERFYYSDQWHGAAAGIDRPLVRHNIIKRIGDYKMGVLASIKGDISFNAEGVFSTADTAKNIKRLKKDISEKAVTEVSKLSAEEKDNLICSALSAYYKTSAKGLRLEEKLAKLLTKSFISGTGVLYTYWKNDMGSPDGDLECEVLSCENICFADNSLCDVQKQKFIIVAAKKDTEVLKRQAVLFGDKHAAAKIREDIPGSSKTTVLTKFFKETDQQGKTRVMACCVCEDAVIRPVFDTGLSLYPINVFAWEQRDNRIFGDSEITHIIPNQIAINRMITAQVWSAMSMGMPIMTVNGDTVSGEITNDPGQIIKVYGSNEDVAGAIHYVTPPDFSSNFEKSIESLINNTLESSSASGVIYSNLPYNNTAAISALKESNDISLNLLKNRYVSFLIDAALVWLDFCISKYGKRNVCIEDDLGRWYFPFDSDDCRHLKFSASFIEIKDNKGEEV